MDSETVFKETEIGLVPEKWEVKELGDLVTIKSGKRLPKGKTVVSYKTKHPYIRVRDLSNGTVNISDVLFIDDETHQAISRYIITKDDVYISIVGTIGLVGIIPKDLDNANLTENCARLTSLKGTTKEWIYYFLSDKKGQDQISSLTVGTTQGKLALYRIKKIKLPLPPLFEQQAIAEILSNIDLKIELNRKMNRILEAVGEAVFKRWFVDFEFPNQEGKPYKTTGGQMTYNEEMQKEIPQGGKVGCIEAVAEVIGGGTPSTKVSSYFTTAGIPWLTPKDLSGFEGKFIAKGATDLTPEGLKNSSAKAMPKGAILFTSRAPIGYIAIALNDIATNQGFKSLVPKDNMEPEYLYQYVKRITPYIQSISSGSTFGEVTGSTIKQIKILIPELNLLQKFQSFMEPINLRIINNSSSSRALKEIRELLLPKLMSGKIRVPVDQGNLEAHLCQK